MDPELKAALDELRHGIVDDLTAKIEAGDAETRRQMVTRLDLDDLRHEVASKSDLAGMERRLTDSIGERLTDDRTQYGEIEKLKTRVKRLESQVRTLTGAGRKKQ